MALNSMCRRTRKENWWRSKKLPIFHQSMLRATPGGARCGSSNLSAGPAEVTGDLAATNGVSAGKRSSWFP